MGRIEKSDFCVEASTPHGQTVAGATSVGGATAVDGGRRLFLFRPKLPFLVRRTAFGPLLRSILGKIEVAGLNPCFRMSKSIYISSGLQALKPLGKIDDQSNRTKSLVPYLQIPKR